MSIQNTDELHEKIAHELQSSMSLRMALVTTFLIVLVGLGGYLLGAGHQIRLATQSNSPSTVSARNKADQTSHPTTVVPAANAATTTLPPLPPRPNR